MKALNLPSGSRELIVAADGDEPGKIAANSLASRATALGWQVSMLPAPDGLDWNDVLQSEVAA
jgi:DNA primase